jgi:hypothetical protein
VALASAAAAALPPGRDGTAVVLFGPDTSAPQAMAAISDADGRVLWSNGDGRLWAIRLEPDSSRAALYTGGAWMVSRSFLAGCLAWTR